MMIVRITPPRLLAALALLTACVGKTGEVGALDSTASGTDDSTTSGSDESSETVGTEGTDGSPPTASCDDADHDGVDSEEDNSDDNHNPAQGDQDGDGIADVVDLCATLGGDPNNSADSDSDGIGNECDTCRQNVDAYNENAQLAGVPYYMQVRNVPSQSDFDQDGIGDACDNCPWVQNCDSYGDENSYELGDPIPYDDENMCQQDMDGDLMGDACQGMVVGTEATAPVGFGDDDDFDQDGISNELDACPRQPILHGADVIACTTAEECPGSRACDDGWCNHEDTDSDGVGDVCDTCPRTANPEQVVEGGAQEDDPDGDFIGAACETAPACNDYNDSRPYGFHRVQAHGYCCTQRLYEATAEWDDPSTTQSPDVAVGDVLDVARCTDDPSVPGACPPIRVPHPEDPSATLPLRSVVTCPEQQVGGVWVCRQLGAVALQEGVLSAPPGCEDALSQAGIDVFQNTIDALTIDDFADEDNPGDALWQNQCFFPPFDQDFDGLGDVCDFCPFAFDPDNVQYIDDEGMLWPTDGKYCNGEFLCE